MLNKRFRNLIATGVLAGILVVPVTVSAVGSETNSVYGCFKISDGMQTQRALQETQPVCASTARWVNITTGEIQSAGTTTTTTQATTTTVQPTTTTQPATTTTQPATTTTTTQPTTSYRAAVMADTPLAYWRFGNTSSETGVHNGTLRGSPLPLLGQPGPFAGSQSIRFDGVLRGDTNTQGFLANSIARLSETNWINGFTLEAWAKTTTSGPEQHVVTWSHGSGDAGPGLMYDDPDNRWKYRDGDVSTSMNGSTTINAWHHIVATVDASGSGTLYVDGQEVQSWMTADSPVTSSSGLFTIGADYDSHDCPCPHVDTPFNGWIAEVAIYNKELAPARVQAHFVAR